METDRWARGNEFEVGEQLTDDRGRDYVCIGFSARLGWWFAPVIKLYEPIPYSAGCGLWTYHAKGLDTLQRKFPRKRFFVR